ncbi:MAG: hypothetical protein Kow0075_01020 [Salibacteraceae bacterium]
MNRFDKIIKQKLEAYEASYDPDAWQNVSSMLHKSPAIQEDFTKGLVAGLAAVAVIFATMQLLPGVKYSDHRPGSDIQTVEVNHVNGLEKTTPADIAYTTADNEKITPQDVHEFSPKFSEWITDVVPAPVRSTPGEKISKTKLGVAENDPASDNQHKEIKSQDAGYQNLPEVKMVAKGTECAGSTVELTATGETTGFSIEWLIDGVHLLDGNPVQFTFEEDGTHEVTIMLYAENMATHVLKNEIDIFPVPNPEISVATVPNSSCHAQMVELTAEPTNHHYRWVYEGDTVAHGESAQLRVEPGDRVFTLFSVNRYGCTGISQAKLTVTDHFGLLAPTAFSPNNDGLNDTWIPVLPEKCSLHNLRVFRASDGKEVYYSPDGTPWNGSLSGSLERARRGEYFQWSALVTDACGQTKTAEGLIQIR